MTYWRRSYPCAFCKKDDDVSRLIHYSTRRYAHAPCLVERKGREFLQTLPLCPRQQAERILAEEAK